MVNLEAKEELLQITKLISFSIRFITFDWGLISKIAGKLFSLLYILITVFLTVNNIQISVEHENIFEVCLGICTTIGLGIHFTKVLTMCYYEDEIVQLFKWIEDFYLNNSEPILAKLRAESLYNTLWILKLFFKFYISSILLVINYAIIYYYIYDIQVINVPWMPKPFNVYFQIIIYCSFTLIYGIPIICFGCMGIIFIGILKFFNESIALLGEKATRDELLLILHKLHCEVYEKFCIYENILSFSIFFDFFFNTTSIIGLMLMIRLYPTLNILYIFIATLVSQLLIYCIFGQFIFTETEKIPESLYMTKWYDLNREDRRALLLMMMMSSRPFGLKTAGMYDINIVLFVKIMKLCFSYCAILYAFL
uniref:Odorant receptor n=1 Tax=Lutzomyia longipalpis TaxID=7200 RepID=A0A240SXU8_LUTLO